MRRSILSALSVTASVFAFAATAHAQTSATPQSADQVVPTEDVPVDDSPVPLLVLPLDALDALVDVDPALGAPPSPQPWIHAARSGAPAQPARRAKRTRSARAMKSSIGSGG